jgi:large subunit ribosomal protein L21
MYAIIDAGGKQYKVEKDSVLRVELLPQEVGSTVKFDVVMLNKDGVVSAGKELANAYAEAVIVKNGKGPKIIVFKYKSKKNERNRQGQTVNLIPK